MCVCVCARLHSYPFRGPSYDDTPRILNMLRMGPRKTLAKNAENVMFYHLRGVSAPRTSMDFKYYYICEDTQVLRSICNSGVCGGGCVCVFCRGHCTPAHSLRLTVSSFLHFALKLFSNNISYLIYEILFNMNMCM